MWITKKRWLELERKVSSLEHWTTDRDNNISLINEHLQLRYNFERLLKALEYERVDIHKIEYVKKGASEKGVAR